MSNKSNANKVILLAALITAVATIVAALIQKPNKSSNVPVKNHMLRLDSMSNHDSVDQKQKIFIQKNVGDHNTNIQKVDGNVNISK